MIQSDEYVLTDRSHVMVRRLSNYADTDGCFRYSYAILDPLARAAGGRHRPPHRRGPGRRSLRHAGHPLRPAPGLRGGPGPPGLRERRLFSPDLAEWAQAHADELATVALQLRDEAS